MSGTNDRIQGSIDKMYFRIENGKPKVKRHKTTTTAHTDLDVESRQAINPETTKICKQANKESHNPVSDTKRKLSQEMRKDLEINN